MTSDNKIALTGAAGNMGRVLRAALPLHGIRLRSAARTPLEPLFEGEDVVHGDLREPSFVNHLLADIETVVHMAGTSVERPLPEIIQNNLIALHELYEGARRSGVRRIIFASSNHAFGMYPVQTKLTVDAAFRPDGMYGLSKAWGDLMGQMYWDKHGIEGIALRIGSCEREPSNFRHLSTWLSHPDTVRLIVRCIQAPAVGFQPVWGVSKNERSYWEPVTNDSIGYLPESESESHAARVLAQPNPLDPTAQLYQGGSFVTIDFTAQEDRATSRRRPSVATTPRKAS